MTLEEAEKLAKVFETADSGCAQCVRDICMEASGAGLGFEWWLATEENGLCGAVKVKPKEQS